MRRSYTPTYRTEMRLYERGQFLTAGDWETTRYGRPTDANLARKVAAFEESTRTGSNRHLGPTMIAGARVIRQSTGTVVATYHGPLFVAAW